jgi:PAS domain S-box-containing protein
LGINPYRAFEHEYQNFFDLVAGNVATAIATACAFETERQRVEALAELDCVKTSFFNNISHEFRTPLTLMLSPLEQTLAELYGSLPTQARSQLELAQRSGKRLLKLVNTLLDFSRIQAGRAQAQFEPVDLAAYTAELASLFRSAVEQAGLQFTVDCPPLPEPIYVDRDMWEKTVLNLISNAFKFTFEGEIAVSLHSVGNQVALIVRDTGTGIPADELPRLFERFHRVEGARGRTIEGTGIGLSLVQELVHLQGGTISVESTPDQGSTFTVQLPTGVAHLPSAPLDSSIQPSASGTQSYVQEALGWLSEGKIGTQTREPENSEDRTVSPSARILLVDDNADMRNYLHRILSEFYEVDEVADGETALAAVYNRPPDLILSDVMMPGMDGFALLQQLRRDPRSREIPILLLSARAGEESAVEGLEAGADDYLIKPFSRRELLARIATNVELGRSRQAAARHQLEAVLSSVSDFIYTFDLAGRFTYANQPLLDLLQKSSAEVVGRDFFELDYPTNLATRLQQQIQQVIATRQPIKDETPYTSAFGSRAYEYVLVPLFGTGGAVESVAGTTRDITERKQAEEALRQSEARFRALVSASSNVVYCMSADWSEMHELQGGDFMADTPEPSRDWLQKYIHPDDQARVLEAIHAAIHNKRLFELEHRVRRVDGTLGWTYSRAVPLLDSASEIIEWFGEASDISDRKRIEAEREQIREAAERANQIKDEFLAVLSHELRTPLNPILGWTRLLRSGALDEAKTAHAIETIERNAKLQVQLIEDLLDISRVLRGKLSLNVMPVELNRIISSALETVRLSIEAKSLQIQMTLPLTVGLVNGDAARLQQVFWNLLSNAVKFTPEGGQIAVTLTQSETYAQIQVTDTGKGIRPDFLPYVFEHFRQEDGAITRKFGGLGLGLAIARQIIELHGGTVKAESAGEGQGATFTVNLPLLKTEVREPLAEPSPTLPPAAAPLLNVRVLVVDDEIDTRELTTFVLEQAGAIVTAVSSAFAALNALAQSQPDVLISDIGMPKMDGYALMRQIQQLPNPVKSVPAIALTAYAGEVDQQQAIESGFQQHLSKPIEPERLISAVRNLCDRVSEPGRSKEPI